MCSFLYFLSLSQCVSMSRVGTVCGCVDTIRVWESECAYLSCNHGLELLGVKDMCE